MPLRVSRNQRLEGSSDATCVGRDDTANGAGKAIEMSETSRISCRRRQLGAVGAAFGLLVIAQPLVAVEPELLIELNKLEDTEQGCRSLFLFDNGTGHELNRFRVVSFAEDRSRSRAISIVNTCVPAGEISRSQLLAAARAGGDYLVRAEKPDGSFHYSYNPLRDHASERVYNIVRHAGTAVALLDLYRATREARYLEAARRAVGYLKTRFRPARENNAVYVLDNDGKAKLGANGLALIALAGQITIW